MTTEEHKHLADIVKETHALLRADYHQYGAEMAWKRHLARNDVLQVCFKFSLLRKLNFVSLEGVLRIRIYLIA